ncbi:hypothetical protein UFOVP263_42 [uncultured Caudovirales phage]|uniref:Tip attachment protein J n=1 Tax=uncultured Caudovirales phage TaxID=2100421 RepID=A0A6J5LI78_9CAUD|nr:hypothetical protein UFOVP263_42 [uncultured Caudovirales phage]CAB4242021.1 hypothetical protein UFOVP91_20 [uncultured Caudovirales phage]
MVKFIALCLVWLLWSSPAYAIGTIIATAMALYGTEAAIVAFAINMVVSMVISKIFAPDIPNGLSNQQPNPGNRQQLPPAGDNKIPVIYGSAYTGGIITDVSISSNNQDIYWAISLCEVTNTASSSTGGADTITFGKIYWGGKLVIFSTTAGELYKVTGLKDESTSEIQDVSGYMDIWLYNNGSNSPTNSSSSAIAVMSSSGLVYTWSGSNLMSNCAFAIVHIRYSQSRNLVGLSQTRFQVNNSRSSFGDCFLDYFTSVRYGAAISLANVNTASLTALNTYCNQTITYTLYGGGTSTQPRFKCNGLLDTNLKIMQNIQSLADSCDCLVKYNEITGLWGVIVQTPTNPIVMDINDSNMISAITVNPIDISSSFNIIEAKFPDGGAKDSFNSANFDLAIVNPTLLYPNEPVNKQSVNLYFCNNSIQAQITANRMLEAAREDLQLSCEINYIGLQLEAGDVVTVTNANYGWVAKQFRIMKVTEKFSDSGQVSATLQLMEFNSAVYDDANVTQFTPAPNTGLGSPTAFGTVPAPTISSLLPNAANPTFNVTVTTSSAGITQYAEIWYSAYQYPTDTQRIFAGTTAVNSNGDPYNINTAMPAVQLFNIPAGNWYFFSRMVNAIASSSFSLASSVLQWRPTTFQFSNRWLSVAYADSITGTGFSLSPTNKQYFGLLEQTNTSSTPLAASTTPSDYKWYLSDPLFGTNKYLVYINYGNRKFGFDTDFAQYAGGSSTQGIFVPSSTTIYDVRLWTALDPTAAAPSTYANAIDLDHSTGQVIQQGYVTGSPSTGTLNVTNTNDGRVTALLSEVLPQIPPDSLLTTTVATLTIDRYGRIVGFTTPDNFYFSFQNITATASQTVFTPTARVAGYITGQDLIYRNGILLVPTSDYTETSTTFTLTTGAAVGDIISVVSMRAVSSGIYYSDTYLKVLSTSTNTAVWTTAQMPYQLINVGDIITFANTGSPTQYTVTGVNYTTRTITFSATVTGVAAGASIYLYRAASTSYPCFSRWDFDLTATTTYTPTTWAVDSGFELLYINGASITEQDYDIISGALTNFPAIATGKMTMIQLNNSNLNQPVGSVANTLAFTVVAQTLYSVSYSSAAGFDLFANGCFLNQTIDYTTSTNAYTLANAPTNSSTALLQQSFARAGAA